MRTRTGFVSNSSSTSYLITNITKQVGKTLVDFVKENPYLVNDFAETYGYTGDSRFTQEVMIRDAEMRNITFPPLKAVECEFGDHSGPYAETTLGHVFDYILRDHHGSGASKSFRWKFLRHNR
jgi:hypothetical protein